MANHHIDNLHKDTYFSLKIAFILKFLMRTEYSPAGTRKTCIFVIWIRSYKFKRAFYPHAQEVLITEALLTPLKQVAKQGQQNAFQVESKTNPQKEMTFSNQLLCFRTDLTTSHHLLE